MRADYLRFRDRFADALDPEWQSIVALDELVDMGAAYILTRGETALLFEIQDTPKGSIVFGLVCCGDMDVLMNEIRPALEQWAVGCGCVGLAFAGREGWGRVMAGQGYRVKQVICVKEIGNG